MWGVCMCEVCTTSPDVHQVHFVVQYACKQAKDLPAAKVTANKLPEPLAPPAAWAANLLPRVQMAVRNQKMVPPRTDSTSQLGCLSVSQTAYGRSDLFSKSDHQGTLGAALGRRGVSQGVPPTRQAAPADNARLDDENNHKDFCHMQMLPQRPQTPPKTPPKTKTTHRVPPNGPAFLTQETQQITPKAAALPTAAQEACRLCRSGRGCLRGARQSTPTPDWAKARTTLPCLGKNMPENRETDLGQQRRLRTPCSLVIQHAP